MDTHGYPEREIRSCLFVQIGDTQLPTTTPFGGTILHRRNVTCHLPQTFWKDTGRGGLCDRPLPMTLEFLALYLPTFPDSLENRRGPSPCRWESVAMIVFSD